MQTLDPGIAAVTPDAAPRATILIADDAAHTRRLYAMLLESRGLAVLEAEDAGQALDLYRQHRPDLVLLDVTMPGGGLTALAGIKVIEPRARVIMVTALSDAKTVKQAISAGIVDYLVKPFNRDRLVTSVERFLG